MAFMVLWLIFASAFSSNSMTTSYIKIFGRLQAQVKENFDCSPQTVLVSISNTTLTNNWLLYLRGENLDGDVFPKNTYNKSEHQGNLLLDVNAKNMTVYNSISHPVRFRYHCSTVFVQVSYKWQYVSEPVGNDLQSLEENLSKLTTNLGITFFIYFSTSEGEVGLAEPFLKVTAITENKLFLIPNNSRITVLKQSPGIPGELLTLGIFTEESNSAHREIFTKTREDLEGRQVSVALSPLLEAEFEVVKSRGIWIVDNLALVYEALCKLNATVEIMSIFGLPFREKSDEGEWDGYTSPLIDGSAAIANMILPSSSKLNFVYFSQPYAHDSAIFVVDLPEKIKFESYIVLKDPLENQVWAGLCISISIMVFFLQLVLYSQHGNMFLLVAQVVVCPIVDQISDSRNLRAIWKIKRIRFLFGLWLLSLIVISCAYKCNLISAIVIPKYSKVPTTFEELSRSPYEMGAVLYTGIMENDFKMVNNAMSQRILHRAVEYDYLSPECYQMILEDKKACLLYVNLLEEHAAQFLVDIHGNDLYYRSEDTQFHGYISFGISKYYPIFLEPLNYVIGMSNSFGLSDLYHKLARRDIKKKGRANALKFAGAKPYYKGDKGLQSSILNKQFIALVTEVLFAGSLIASIVFLVEVITKLLHARKTLVLPGDAKDT